MLYLIEKNTLDLVRRLKATDHGILFYLNPENCRQVLFDYVITGLSQKERVICVSGWEKPQKFQRAMEVANVDVKIYEKNDALRFISCKRWYMINGEVDATYIMGLWQKTLDETLGKGFRGLRICSETNCLFSHHKMKELVEYERACGKKLKLPIAVLCAYDLDQVKTLGEKFFLDLLKAHGYLLCAEPNIGGEVVFKSVDEGLKKALGSVAKEMIICNLKNRYGLEKEDIPGKFMILHEALRDLFGIGVEPLESMIFKELYSNFISRMRVKPRV